MADLEFAAALAHASPTEFLRLEAEAGRTDRFAGVDHLAADLMAMALSGSRIIDITQGIRGTKNSDVLTLTSATSDRQFIENTFALANQQARGAWFLPEQASLKAVAITLPAYLRHQPWHAITLASEEVARTRLASTPDAMVTWALLIPLFDALLAPITERAAGSSQPGDEQQARWTTILKTYKDLGVRISPAVEGFAYRGGWSKLDRAGQVQARIALLDTLTTNDVPEIAARFRAMRIQQLIAATSKKARRGTPLARQALTKAVQPTLAAYFAGDWLAFLDYLGLSPNTNEEIVTALPTPKLYVGGAAKASTVAAERGIDLDDVNAMLAAFLGQDTSVSPVEQRVDALVRWWTEFDAIHARQTPAMRSLWGLVQDGPYYIRQGARLPDQQLYQRLLTPTLVTEIDQLWDGITLPRWPHSIVSEPYPHKLMAETFGPAVTAWHEIALTAWYVCEGPSSRTTLSGMRDYYERHLAALVEAGTPIHPSLFDELESAERYLGPPQDLETHADDTEIVGGLVSIRFSHGQRRDGFEILRDIISRHRAGWAGRYLHDYLRHRWNDELTGVARELHRWLAAKGKVPTFRQFAGFAATAANHWFNGNLAGLYTAIGEKAPETPRRVDLLPIAAHEFVHAVYTELGGEPHDDDLWQTDPGSARKFDQLARLAADSVHYVQITEALGRAPEPKEFRIDRHNWDWADSLDNGWHTYQQAIHQVRSAHHP